MLCLLAPDGSGLWEPAVMMSVRASLQCGGRAVRRYTLLSLWVRHQVILDHYKVLLFKINSISISALNEFTLNHIGPFPHSFVNKEGDELVAVLSRDTLI